MIFNDQKKKMENMVKGASIRGQVKSKTLTRLTEWLKDFKCKLSLTKVGCILQYLAVSPCVWRAILPWTPLATSD